MNEQKQNRILITLLIIFVTLTLSLGGFILYDKILSKENNNVGDTNTNTNNENDESKYNPILDSNDLKKQVALPEVTIKNNEVKELYNYIKADVKGSVCLGYFYQNPFKNHTLEDKVSLVLDNYGNSYSKKIDDKMLQKIDENKLGFYFDHEYIEADVIRKGMKKIFNINVEKFDTEANYTWMYDSMFDAFISIDGGWNYDPSIYQQIIEYNELNDEINLTVAKAEISSSSNTIIGANGKTIIPAGVYRYVNKPNTLVFENITDDFKFTKENINYFPQIKYIFRKNETGNYYIYDILNLNFQEDYTDC